MKTLILVYFLLLALGVSGCSFSPEHRAELQQQQEEMNAHAKAIGENLKTEGQVAKDEARDRAAATQEKIQEHFQPSGDARISDEDVHRIAKEVVKEMGSALDKGK